jgi:hypothetical protein
MAPSCQQLEPPGIPERFTPDRSTRDAANSRAHRTTHDSPDNNPTRRPGRKPCSRICLAGRQWNSHKSKRQSRLEKLSTHGDFLRHRKANAVKLDQFLAWTRRSRGIAAACGPDVMTAGLRVISDEILCP